MKRAIQFIRKNWVSMLTILIGVLVGIMLLVDPAKYAIAIIKIAGAFLTVLAIFDFFEYFQAEPEEAAKGSGFYAGMTDVAIGLFCLLGSDWFLGAFPILAVLYGLFQVLIGFRKMQRMVDALRMKQSSWTMKAISAGITLLFGFVIIFNPNMTLMSVWVFTGLTLILEGIIDLVALFMQERNDPYVHDTDAQNH